MIVAWVFAVAALSGCSPEVTNLAAEVVTVHNAQVAPGQPIATAGKPVLSVYDGSDRTVFDLAGLEKLGTARSRLYEPYVKQNITFEGVPAQNLATYLALDRADRIDVVALDGLELTIGVGDLLDSKALFATRTDGQEIPIADGGPTRLVFPGDPLASDLNQWIWSLATVTILRA
ncbi:hypothetical protein ASE48_01230 [Mycobacterium sp. Root265]|nr:hypothetical protein ASE48_01230 [Mycobacterium sp. Root265]